MSDLLEVDNLRISARNDDDELTPIVKGVSFTVARGEVVALIGESGSGKTTIALSSLGYTKPGLEFTGGEVRLHGEDVISMDSDQLRGLRGQRVAYLAQSAAATFNPALTIGEQVTETCVLHGILTQEEADARAETLYRALELPDPDRLGKRYPHQVSGGQLQRLMAATALCGKPDLLVLDEPTTALDVTTQIEVLKAFKSVIKQEGAAAIYVTHDLSVVAQIADHIVVLYAGEIQEYGTAEQVVEKPSHDYTRRLMHAVRPPPAAGQGDETTGEHRREAPALEVKDLLAGYGRIQNGLPAITVLRDVNVAIERGHSVGIIGESGCGKSTLGRSLLRLIEPTSGQVFFGDEDVTLASKKRLRDLRSDLQMVFQDPYASLNPRLPIRDIVGEPMRIHGVPKNEAKERVGDLLTRVGLLPEHGNRYPHEFSGGQRQRIGIARALAVEPRFIVADEPVSALDVSVQAQVVNLMEELQDLLGLTYLFISHDLGMVRHIADRVAVMYLGRIMELADVNAIYEDPRHPYTLALQSSAPVPDPVVEATREKIVLEGDIPSPSNPPAGCVFCVHNYLQTRHGIVNQENLKLKALADAGIYTFMYIYSPVPITGATGSIGVPVAIY